MLSNNTEHVAEQRLPPALHSHHKVLLQHAMHRRGTVGPTVQTVWTTPDVQRYSLQGGNQTLSTYAM
jgi:hypothetical protein